MIMVGNCVEVLAGMAGASIDACVTDPPYELGFMGKGWDSAGVAFDPATWAAVLRVLKPGAHLVAFGGTRTYHRMVCAIEDAGFEIRDQLAWVYGSGFPKSHNLPGGLGTALKPAWEPIVLARKPLAGTVAANILAHGTGALNIDGCRIEANGESLAGGTKPGGGQHEGWDRPFMSDPDAVAEWQAKKRANQAKSEELGRWPANIIHDGSEEVLAGFPRADSARASGNPNNPRRGERHRATSYGQGDGKITHDFRDTGSAARFFYCAKASRRERGEDNDHPTVKPIALMRWLCRLVTPPGGRILDPFVGSGTTLIAAMQEGFEAIGVELLPEYAEIARSRLMAWPRERQPDLLEVLVDAAS